MPRYTFGESFDDDILEIQGIEYRMQPVGMGVMRKLLEKQRVLYMPNANGDVSPEITTQRLDAAVELILASVVPDERERLRKHIDESVPPTLLVKISVAISNNMADVDPTPRASSSTGSTTDGRPSMDGAALAASTPLS